MFLHRAIEVFVANLNPIFEANLKQILTKEYSKSYLKIKFCIFFAEKFLKITPLHHIFLYFEYFFRQNPLYNSYVHDFARRFCHFLFEKDPAVIFFPLFLAQKFAKFSQVMRFQIFQ